MKKIINLSRYRLVLGFFVLSSLFFTPVVTYAEVSQGTMIEIFQRLDRLEKKSRELVGENEVLKHELSKLKKIQKEGFLNVDERVDALRQQIKEAKQQTAKAEIKKEQSKPVAEKTTTASTPPPKKPETDNKKETDSVKPTTASVVTPTPAPVKSSVVKKESEDKKTAQATKTEQAKKTSSQRRVPSKYEKEAYQAAFAKMKKSPSAATQAFKEYIKMQPNSPLAANSQYWIGEIMYSHNNYKGAIQEFIKVLQKYKYSDKAPDAAIKLGYSFVALKNWNYARRTFEDVLKYFPKNQNAINLANKQLEKLKANGH